MILIHSPACEALSAWVEATGEEVPMPAEMEGSSGGVQPGVSVMGELWEGCAPAAAVGKAMGASAAAVVALVGRAASGLVAALCGLYPALLEVFLEPLLPYDWVTKQHTSGQVEDVDVAAGVWDVMAAADAAVLHSLGQILSGNEPLGLEIDVAHQGSHPHRLLNRRWVGGPAGVEEYPQG